MVTLTAATEADSAVALVAVKSVTLTPAGEVGTAVALVVGKVAVLGVASEVDSAVALVVTSGGTQFRTLGAALEADSAVALSIAVAEWALRVGTFDVGSVVDVVALVSANAEPWAHERVIRVPQYPNRILAVRPQQVPVASVVAGADGVARFATLPLGRFWVVGERQGRVRRVARTID